MGRRSRRLVVDASVAGEPSKGCRAFLEAVLELCHYIVMTPKIADEWKRHARRFARKWRVRMEARKKVQRIGSTENATLRAKIESKALRRKDREAMLKDVHLLEAAIATDRSIISLDEAARLLFADASKTISEIRNIVWVNPEKPDERPIVWLEEGANPDQERMLGFQSCET